MEKEMNNLKRNKNVVKVNGDVNINNYQVNIIAHGKEDLSYLTHDQIQMILKGGLKGPEKYVEFVDKNQKKRHFCRFCVICWWNLGGSNP